MTVDATAIIAAARDLLARSDWCQRTLAQDAADRSVWPHDAGAVAFCASGAVLVAARRLGASPEQTTAAMERLHVEARRRGCCGSRQRTALVQWNDRERTRREDVLALFCDALETVEVDRRAPERLNEQVEALGPVNGDFRKMR